MAAPNSKLRRQQFLDAHAHRMRLAPSEPERVLWQALRCRQLGVQFRRQVVLLGFIVDFCAPAARLVVEVDGAHHAQRRGADKRRDRALAAAGFRVLRLPAQGVLRNLAAALQLVAAALETSGDGAAIAARQQRTAPSAFGQYWPTLSLPS